MAISNTSALAELIDRVWDKPFTDLVSRDFFMLKRIPKLSGGGDGVRWKVQNDVKNTSAASYSEGDGAGTAVAHQYLDARLVWRYVWVWIEVTGQMQAQAEGMGGFDGYRNVIQNETEQSILDLRSAINTMLLATSLGSASDIDGFGVGVKNSTSYATIDPTTYTAWKSYANSTSSALTMALMQDVKTTVEDTPRFGNVSVIPTGPVQWNNYGNLIAAQRRFTPQQTLDGGFQALDFEGVPVVKVPGFPTSRMDFWSEKDAKGKANFQYRVLKNFETKDKSAGTADSMKFMVTHYAQLQVRNRRTQGYLSALA